MAKKTINIYLDKTDRDAIDKLKVKYELSLTTIVDILVFVTTKYLENTEIYENLQKDYIYNKGKKTSIKKPKIFNSLNWENLKECKYCTNVLLLYVRKDIKKYIKDQETLNKYYNLINQKMTTTKDEFWNYNNHIRMQRRMLKENKDYFRKALENA